MSQATDTPTTTPDAGREAVRKFARDLEDKIADRLEKIAVTLIAVGTSECADKLSTFMLGEMAEQLHRDLMAMIAEVNPREAS